MTEKNGTDVNSNASPALLDGIVSNSRDAILVTEAGLIDEPGPRIVYLNEAFTRMTGYTREEMIGNTPRILQGPGTERARLDEIRAALSRREPVRTELLNYHKDGTGFWVEVDIVPLDDEHGNHTHWISIQRDVTERRKQQENLKESEERLRTILVQYASDLITILDADGTIRYESPAIERLLGYKPEELVGANILDYVHPRDVGRVASELDTLRYSSSVSNSVEIRIRHKSGSWIWLEGIGNNLLDDPSVGGIVINSRDVTRRKQAEEQLRSTEERYRALVEHIPAAVYIAKPLPGEIASYEVSYMSPRIADFLGYSAQRFTEDQDFWNEIIHPDDLAEVVAEDQRTDESGEPFLMEYRVTARDGHIVWIREESLLIRDSKGEALYWQGFMADVTQRRQAQEALRESEERYSSIAKSIREIVFETDAEGNYTFLNAAWEEITGFTVQESLGKSYLEFIHPDDLQRNLEDSEQIGEHGGDYTEYEARYLAKDGSPRDVEIKFREHLDDAGNMTGISGTVNDITERKQTERERQESEQRFRQLFEQSVDAVYVHDEDGNFVDCNTQACNLLGYTREELLSMSVGDISRNVLTEEERAEREREGGTLWQCVMDGEPGTFSRGHEEVNVRKDGTPFPVEVRVGSVDYGGQRMVLASVRDVTERKRNEAALRKSEERYRSVVGSLKEVVFQTDARGLWMFLNAAWEEITGFTVEESLGESFLDYVYPDDRERDAELFRTLIEGDKDYCQHEIRYLTRSGEFRWVEVFARLTLGNDGDILGTSGTLNDITERKKTENELQESEQRFRTAFEGSSTGLALVDLDGQPFWVNQALQDILGYSKEEIMTKGSSGLSHPDDLPQTEARDERILSEDGPDSLDLEKRYIHKDGSIVWTISGMSVVRDASGSPRHFLCQFQDITERKETEDELQESEQRFRGAFDYTSTGMALVGLDNRYLRVNRALCDLLGYTEEEFLSKRTLDITHPEDQVKSRDRTRRILGEDGPGAMSIEKRYLKKDGGVLWALSDASLIRNSRGEPSHFISHFQDITERKNLEERLLYQALHDPLTGLPNRSSLHGRFERVIRRLSNPSHRRSDGTRSGTGYVAILFLDLDGFKELNDSLGHAAGDEILRAVSERLRNHIRPEDTVARLGGDEFCVLLSGVSSTEETLQIAERVKGSVDKPFSVPHVSEITGSPPGASNVLLSTSIGIAVSEPSEAGKSLDELLREADAAMYRAKQRGGALYELVDLTENTG